MFRECPFSPHTHPAVSRRMAVSSCQCNTAVIRQSRKNEKASREEGRLNFLPCAFKPPKVAYGTSRRKPKILYCRPTRANPRSQSASGLTAVRSTGKSSGTPSTASTEAKLPSCWRWRGDAKAIGIASTTERPGTKSAPCCDGTSAQTRSAAASGGWEGPRRARNAYISMSRSRSSTGTTCTGTCATSARRRAPGAAGTSAGDKSATGKA